MQVLGSATLLDDYDVIVVGSGAGGLVAALRAAHSGMRVLVLEKASQIGGTSGVSAGTVWIPNNPGMREAGIEDSLDDALLYLRGTVGESPVAESFVTHAVEMMEFIQSVSPIELTTSRSYPDYQPKVPGAKVGRAVQPGIYDTRRLGDVGPRVRRDSVLPYSMIEFKQWGSWNNFPWAELRQRAEDGIVARGAAIVGPLLEGCLELGVHVAIDAAVDGLIHDTRVNGVTVGERRIGASAGVVLASGGFEWNEAMMAEYLPDPIAIKCSPPYATGDGHRMAAEVGAAFANMGEAWWAPMAVVPGQTVDGQQVGRHLRSERQSPGVIIVDPSGRRFVNEARDYNSLIRAAIASAHEREVPLKMFVVFDQRFFERYGFLTHSADGELPGFISTGETLADLAAALDIDGDALIQTVARFNGFAEAGVDEDFHRGENDYERFGGDPTNPYPNANMAPLEVGPYYGMEFFAGAFGTAGGIVTDTEARAIREDGSVIEGLYATGNVTAQPLATGYPGAGSTLGPAMTLGYLAGQDLARRAVSARP
ncbi:MAG: FAD-dependent oxidoreductase [Rhodoglobus sp.]|nr:FAD-dependent oxidoreductase [Rhodoglobus sp.]